MNVTCRITKRLKRLHQLEYVVGIKHHSAYQHQLQL